MTPRQDAPVDGAGRARTESTAEAEQRYPFASFLRTIGRGPNLSRPLTRDEAAAAMTMVLENRVEPAQLGALMLVLRFRGETPAELAGFVDAARAKFTGPRAIEADLDWPSYADRHKQLPYFVLSALLLAQQGLRVVMHGISGVSAATTPAVLRALGLAPAGSWSQAAQDLQAHGFAYLPLAVVCPPLMPLFELRPVLGVRSPANSFCRDLNPSGAPGQMQGVFHPTYLPVHQETALLLGQPRAAIFKGGGGEAQCNPEKPVRVATVIDGAGAEEIWPALTPDGHHPWREETLDPAAVVALWRGEASAPGPEASIVATAAVALKLTGRAATQQEALSRARAMWSERDRRRFG